MDVVHKIINSIKKIKKTDEFDKYRKILKTKKKLPKKDWCELQNIVKTTKLYNILQSDLTIKESRILGNAITSVKLNYLDDIIDLIIKRNDDTTPYLLTSVLSKKCKINTDVIYKYIIEVLNDKVKLVHLGLLYLIYKNYRSLIDRRILDYCKQNDHNICKEILNLEMECI